MTVQVKDPSSGRVELLETGISLNRLKSSRDISALVAKLRDGLAHDGTVQVHYRTA
ncbi:hypothetical protein ALQ33_102128 [Pseudomonas syringae pv. philadelphi]|nr:Uncharacterized protein AC507_2931 [Pseudomonas syringae pv. maculicola]KPW21449.1 hypothetical protein ALO83_103957 [Pseudomonas cannabina pv. alisalensis]RMN76259.1 hypothetical protein ALQ53_103699 [Pseudomonas cannabina]RMN90206.1 hypothetical protein ALQ52_104675 [Pseudomonas cannabina pv. alisalensis]RMO82452.1 hypothetical protein ALQ33_102128 [Pseudomonas syringae pv. philadelphi]